MPRAARTLLALPPLGIWFPYEWYRVEHLRHHATADLAGPHDPESFYHGPEAWARTSAPLRALYLANQTLAGRIVLGPALQIGRAYAGEARRLTRGDASRGRVWLEHVVLTCGLFVLLWRCGIHPVAYVACVAYPAASLGLIRSFAEHRYAGSIRERTAIVESTGALSLLFLNNNLHAVHHRHPGLPWFELPGRYRAELDAKGYAGAPLPLRGYRAVARAWFWRPIDSPVVSRPAGGVEARSGAASPSG